MEAYQVNDHTRHFITAVGSRAGGDYPLPGSGALARC